MQAASLQQLLDQISSICNAHAQVGSYQYCEEPEVDTGLPMPLVIGLVVDASQQGIVMNYKFAVLVMDLVNKSEDNKFTVSSNTHQIAKDIIAKLRVTSDFYVLDEAVNYKAVYEHGDADCTGWAVDFTMKTVNPFDSCDVPGVAICDEYENILVDQDQNIVVYE